jgi:excisionase family DNA binding protein
MASGPEIDLTAWPLFLTLQEVQAVLGLSRPTVYALAHTPGFPAVRVRRRILVPRDAFVQWLEQHHVTDAPAPASA